MLAAAVMPRHEIVLDDDEIDGLPRFVILAEVLHHLETEQDAPLALLVALHSLFRYACLLQVVAVHEDVAVVRIHDDEPEVLHLVEELQLARVSLILLDLQGAHVAIAVVVRHAVLPPGGRHLGWGHRWHLLVHVGLSARVVALGYDCGT